MTETLKIGDRTFHKTSGVFEVSLEELSLLRLAEIPYYSTVEIKQLPGTFESYTLSISATHAGGPNNEEFFIHIHVYFVVPGNSEDPHAVALCNRRRHHIRRFFRDPAGQLNFRMVAAPFTDWGRTLYSGILFSRYFEREENPVLREIIQPFVIQFEQFLNTKHTVLFLCHASEDKPFVDELCTFLEHRQVDVWYDRKEIKVGESIVQRISGGLGAASHLVVALSGSSVKKNWVLKELSSALMRQLQDSTIHVLPVLIEDCSIPPLLADIKYADCRANNDTGFSELLEAL
jgi:TIR domain